MHDVGTLFVGMHINDVSGQIVDAAIKVYSVLGPGLLERAYQVCLAHELGKRGVRVGPEVPMPARYAGVELDLAYRIDLLVEECVVVEIKAVAKILPVYHAQLLSHLKLSDQRVGLFINFNVARLRDGIVRMVNHV
jgi:GxxExxY protein